MKKEYNLTLSPEVAYNQERFEARLRKISQSGADDTIRILKRSIDARSPNIKVNVKAEVYNNEQPPSIISYQKEYKSVRHAAQVIIVGAGPAGLFAALRLIELGIKPVVIERGKDVRARRRDIAAINKEHVVNPESNYCFGEGGAGTYSDGKLYTRSKKRGDILRILEILVAHGAREEILFDAHPHIGTNKLPNIVADLRNSIIEAGGEVHFNKKVTGLILNGEELEGVEIDSDERLTGKSVILATGHSARDIFHILQQAKIEIEAKPFALGVRVEHDQQLIDRIQYHCKTDRGAYLPASSYSLVNQATYKGEKRGVFSFCMCPGGFIVPAATASGEVVVNGMSPSRRDSKYANSGIVVSVEKDDLKAYQKYGELAAMHFQSDIEKLACQAGGNSQAAPGQRMVDFVHNRVSQNLPDTSYQPGLTSVNMSGVLPAFIAERLKYGFKSFGKKMKGYYTNNAQIVGVESRTSSPIRIPRNKETLEHVRIKKLFPCGEGAGYAGGIMSAAMDGERCAEAAVSMIKNK